MCVVCKKQKNSMEKWHSKKHAGFGSEEARMCPTCFKSHAFCPKCGGSGCFYVIHSASCDDFEDCHNCDQKGYISRTLSLFESREFL